MILFTVLGFSQENKAKIQAYLNQNKAKYNLSDQDISDWIVESTGNSESTKIDTYWIKQRYQGIEVFNGLSNAWIKNNEVINIENGFISNISQKINTTTPNLSVLNALSKGFLELNEINTNGEIVETISANEFKISNGIDEGIKAELVFQPIENTLKLAWDYTIPTSNGSHLWSIRIDATTGQLLVKKDMVISCNFYNHNCEAQSSNFSFYKDIYKESNALPIVQVQGGSYRVVPFNFESPNHTNRQLISNPENALSSPKGWHDANTLTGTTASLKYTYTRGNNVWARANYTGTESQTALETNLPYSTTTTANGYAPNGGAGLSFDYAYAGTSVAANTYIDASVTNLFYMNNIMHDVWHRYGFNEVNGNYQDNNYGIPSSSGSDAVYANAQYGSTASPQSLNNANFSANVDGTSGTMRMFLWSYRKVTQLLTVNSPSDIAGAKYTTDNGFNPGHVNVPVAPAMIQSNIVLYDDGTPDVGQTDNADGCAAATNAAAINGNITIIRRSTSVANGGNPCTFADKALNAKNAGATAVIIVNNDTTAPNSSVGMSGADANITIPVISVSLNNGEAIITKLKNGETVNAKIQSDTPLNLFVNTDGDLDNGVIAHEYGHGISTRLAGGRLNSSCLQNYDQMGEGWSDWFAMMMQIKPGDVGETPRGLATFVINQDPDGGGLRSYPYSTDMTINPLTYNDSNSAIPSDPADTSFRYVNGDFWATVLWDLNWAYIQKYGYDDNKYTGTGGNNKVMRLVLDGLKLQPCSPTVVSARDALFAADQATTGGQDYCMIAEVFRRRGVGLNASAGSNQDCDDQVENFDAFPTGPNCTLSVDYFENNELFRVYPNPTNDLLNIRINNYVGKVNIQVIDINGRIVSEFKNEDFNTEKSLNLNNLQAGMYVLKVSGDNLNFTQKIIKN
ncbi:T9SS-dependent M36 family metallopeptidase [Flavobacterium koreense]